jgi:hypothetical protein
VNAGQLKDKTTITAPEMGFMRPAAKCTWIGHKRRESILKELKENSYCTQLRNIKPVGFNISTQCKETDIYIY